MRTERRPLRTASLVVGLAAAVLALGGGVAAAEPVHYTIDKSHSALVFKIKHMGVSYTYGRFNDFTGSLAVDEADLTKSSIELDIAAESIDTGNEERDKHLRNPEFFDTENHPSIGFKSTTIEKVGEDQYRVTGDFTMLGVTRSITIRMKKIGEADDPWGNHRIGYDGQVVIRRSEFGMKAMLDKVGDEVHISLGIEGMRKK